MAEISSIEWTDSTFNPWIGCTKVGPGCDHCYAETRDRRKLLGPVSHWGPGAPRHRTSASTWKQPRAWQAEAATFLAAHGRRRRVFCASMADVFDNEVDPAWRADLFALIRACSDLEWLLLTKRIGNAQKMAEAAGGWPPNVWLGATIVNQAEADRDVPKLLATAGPQIRFLSMEPLLGPVDLTRVRRFAPGVADREWINAIAGRMWTDQSNLPNPDPAWAYPGREFSEGRGLDWVIVGGEAYAGARPMHPDWARSLRDQCAEAGVPFLFKQWGEFAPHGLSTEAWHVAPGQSAIADPLPPGLGRHVREGHWRAYRVGKKLAGRLLDGLAHDGFPDAR